MVMKEEQKWDEKELSPTRKKLISTLEVISGYNAENLLKRLPTDALFEERAILLGKINQHHLALSLYVHKVEKLFRNERTKLVYTTWVKIKIGQSHISMLDVIVYW